ncbi:tight adherence protein B [Spinactinospora alkalitolerans]|uniref:Tight adherence protein B n=1 Tax=Spinactinospora alkalitolerans TaxID=687207 RepID=A0A852TNB0_9ACTN|nr:type II secretion system F family protein [Spinactinospora alkalitolerans]NYE44911.1 tight adherence protein B [Spinactinospora alkalitolerans]
MSTASAWLALLTGHAGWLAALGAAGLAAVRALPSVPEARLRALRPRAPATRRPLPGLWTSTRARIDAASGRGRARWRSAVVELCRVMAAELRGGRTPADALGSAVEELDPAVAAELAGAVAAARGGFDPGPALRGAAARPGAAGLGYLAACWQVASGTGGGLADVVERLAESLAHEEARHRELAANLAGPRTTALLLAALPAAGLLMTTALGGNPLAFLFTTPAGLLCLLAGLSLNALGLWWTHRMVRRVLIALEPR